MPEWSIGAVSKTVDQLAGPRVRIPVSPLKKKGACAGSFFCVQCLVFSVCGQRRLSNQRRVLLLYGVRVDVEEDVLLGIGDGIEALEELLAE